MELLIFNSTFNYFSDLCNSFFTLYQANKQYVWPIYFVIFYLSYILVIRPKIKDKKSLPPCKGTFTNERDVLDISFLGEFKRFVNEYLQEYHDFFVGLCFYCKNPGQPPAEPILRCKGCQLVGYCSKRCMNIDWSTHKYVCREFPLVNGNNALHIMGSCSWKDHIAALRVRAARLPNADIASLSIFRNPRVCHSCREARSDLLTDCKCLCVSYCSENCARSDRPHRDYCTHLAYIAQSYYLCVSVDQETLNKQPWFKMIKCCLKSESLSYPMSLLYALQSIPKRRIGRDARPLEDRTTLDIHVVTSSPTFNSKSWEIGFLHRLPKLKQLRVVFVLQSNVFKPSLYYNIKVIGCPLLRCLECAVKYRVITYSVQQMQYHMYFSSEEYTEPDVVVIYGNTQEMSINREDDINSEMSYRNMAYSRDTILVLMDATKDLVKLGVRALDAAQPVDVLVTPRINESRGLGLERADIDDHAAFINEKGYYTCLRRK